MKKLIFIVGVFFLSINISFAAFFVEGRGEYMATGEFKPVTGFGAGLGLGITDDINFILRFYQAENTENVDEYNETTYEIITFTGGIEYIPPITFLENYRIFWKNSISLGMSDINYKDNSLPGSELDTSGVVAYFRTGIQYNFTQIVSPFFDLGYYKSYFSEYTDLKVAGWQVTIGVRFHIFGVRDYDDGY